MNDAEKEAVTARDEDESRDHDHPAVQDHLYARSSFAEEAPKTKIPEDPMPAGTVYQLITDELNLDGNPAMNLASFVTTWMEPEARTLIREALDKNFVDQDEYPQTAEIEQRVVQMQAELFNAVDSDGKDEKPWGVATIGSSEAIMLGLLAHKFAWRKAWEDRGEEPENEPNVVLGANVHTVWYKFCKYFDVKAKTVVLDPENFVVTGQKIRDQKLIDDGTIAVGAVVGTTFTGDMDDVESINALLEEFKAEKGWDIPLHVDAASGGFILPFTKKGEAKLWDFRLSHVTSINVSNHKFGLVFPGMGSVIFRHKSDIPKELFFCINYLGGTIENYSLNFSRGSSMVLAQYYNFLRLGMHGYRAVVHNTLKNAKYLSEELSQGGRGEWGFIPMHPVDDEGDLLFSIVVMQARDPETLDLVDLTDELRKRGWIIPAYPLESDPHTDDEEECGSDQEESDQEEKKEGETLVMRMVIRQNVSRDVCGILVKDINEAVDHLKDLAEKAVSERPGPQLLSTAPSAVEGLGEAIPKRRVKKRRRPVY